MNFASTATVVTERPARYGKQLMSHFARKITTEWKDDRGFADFGVATARLTTDTEGLRFDVESDTVEALERAEGVIARHLVKFGHRDNVRVDFVRADGGSGVSYGVEDLPVE